MGDGLPDGKTTSAEACGGCGQPVASTAKFCPNCGTAQPGQRTEPNIATGERRRLTILFCDLVGSTALSEQLDPESLGDLVLAYQEMGRSAITRFGGHVAQYLGDGLLAYFGYPVAHEDDAQRAVMAGLAILDGLGAVNEEAALLDIRLEARIGVHAGDAVVGEMGSADRSDTSAFGSTPNVAARIEGVATPGTIAISDEVRVFLDDRFEVEDRGTPALKGIERVIRVWEVKSVGERAPRQTGGSSSPMIGRAAELTVLLDAASRADEGIAQCVLVRAEPGLGKTRLLQELYEARQRTAPGGLWLEGQCSELTSSTPLAPIVGFLRRTLGLDAPLSAADQRRRLDEAMAPLGENATAAAPYLGELLGVATPGPRAQDGAVGEGPELRRRRTLDALAGWVRALARDQTVIVVVEDLHWSDPTTLELLELLVDDPACRLCCVHTHRPETDPFPTRDTFRSIDLGRLGFEDSERLARSLASARGISTAVLDSVALRSDGVPLFIEELVSAAGPDRVGDDEGGVPLTLQALLASRLDQLGDARRVAQAAAVLGREFSNAVLASITDSAIADIAEPLGQLTAAGILTDRQLATGTLYAFRHALIQDAAYASLLRRDRRRLHAAAAAAFAGEFAGLVADAPEVVAHHYVGAEDLLTGVDWYERAGRRAAERAALREAQSHLEQGIRVLDHVAPSPDRSRRMLSLNVLLGNTLMGGSGIGADAAGPVWERAIEAAEELGDDEELTAALNGLAVYHADRADLVAAEACAARELEIAHCTGSRVAGLRGHGTMGMLRLYQARGTEARDHITQALAFSEPGDFYSVTYAIGHDEETFFHVIGSWASWWLGAPDESLRLAREGLALASRIPSSLSQAMARHAVTMAHHLRGEPKQAATLALENAEFTVGLDFPFWRAASEMLLGTQRARLGDERGLTLVEDALARFAATGNESGGSLGMSMLAEAYFGVGRYDDAIGAAELGVAAGEMVQQTFCDTELVGLRGRALVELGRRDEGRAALEESLAIGGRQGARSATLHTAVALAPLVAADDGPDRAHELLTHSLNAMADGQDTVDQREARRQLSHFVGTR